MGELRAAAEAADLVDADAVDLLGRLHRGGDDALELADELLADLEAHDAFAEEILRLVDRLQTRRLDGEALGVGLGQDAHAVGLGLGLGAHRLGAILGRFAVGVGGDDDAHRVLLGGLAGLDDHDLLGALGGGDFLHRLHLLLRLHHDGARGGRLGVGLGELLGLFRHGDARLLAGDVELAFALNLARGDGLLGVDVGLLHRLLGGDLGLAAFALALGALAGDAGLLRGLRHLDGLLLLELGLGLDLAHGQRLALHLEVLLLDGEAGVLLDVVSLLALALGDLGELGETLRVKGVGLLEKLARGLVELGERHGLELETVAAQILGHGLLHLHDELDALLVQLVHRERGGHGAESVHELALKLAGEFVGAEGAMAERLGRDHDVVHRLGHAHVELGAHIDAQTVAGDQRVLVAALHLEAERLQVDLGDLLEERQHEGAAVGDDLAAAPAGAHERALGIGLSVELGDHRADQRDED